MLCGTLLASTVLRWRIYILESLCISTHEQSAIQTKDLQNRIQECQTRGPHVDRSRFFDIAKALLSLFLLLCTQDIMQKLNTRSTLHPCLFLLDKFTSEERRENVALYAAAQDVKLDFVFGLQPVLGLTRLCCRYLVTVTE